MNELGFSIVHESHPPHFSLPCVKLAGASCSVYEKRPQNCRGFRCRVLQRLDTGELSIEQAQSLTRNATSLAAKTAQLLPIIDDKPRSIWARLEAFVDAGKLKLDQAGSSQRHSELESTALALRHLLDDEFKPKKLPGDEI